MGRTDRWFNYKDIKQLSHRKPFLQPGQLLTGRTTTGQKCISVHNRILTMDKWFYEPVVHPPPSPSLQLSIPRSASRVLLIYASQSKMAQGKRLPSYCNKLWVNHSNHWVIIVPHYIFQLNPSVSEDKKEEERERGGSIAQITIFGGMRGHSEH